MRKILIALLGVLLVAALAGAGTFAYFSDTETSTGNTFTAGTLNLQVGTSDPTSAKIDSSTWASNGMKPGDTGNAATWLVQNTGSLAGDLAIGIGTVTNNENTRYEMETAAGDTSDNVGELSGFLKVAIWLDMDKDGKWDTGDKYLGDNGAVTTAGSGITDQPLPEAAYATLDTFSGESYTKTGLGVNIAGNAEMGNFRAEYNFPSSDSPDDDQTQSDSAVFNITFTLTQ
ncbi:MAG: TasA family protein [Bacillota bacterium]